MRAWWCDSVQVPGIFPCIKVWLYTSIKPMRSSTYFQNKKQYYTKKWWQNTYSNPWKQPNKNSITDHLTSPWAKRQNGKKSRRNCKVKIEICKWNKKIPFFWHLRFHHQPTSRRRKVEHAGASASSQPSRAAKPFTHAGPSSRNEPSRNKDMTQSNTLHLFQAADNLLSLVCSPLHSTPASRNAPPAHSFSSTFHLTSHHPTSTPHSYPYLSSQGEDEQKLNSLIKQIFEQYPTCILLLS